PAPVRPRRAGGGAGGRPDWSLGAVAETESGPGRGRGGRGGVPAHRVSDRGRAEPLGPGERAGRPGRGPAGGRGGPAGRPGGGAGAGRGRAGEADGGGREGRGPPGAAAARP